MKLVIIEGLKGGVGKTTVSICTKDYFFNKKIKKITTIETDSMNPDAGRSMGSEHFFEIKQEDSWSEFLYLMEDLKAQKQDIVIVNTPAGDTQISENFEEFKDYVDALGIDVYTLFVMNRSSECVNLLEYSINKGFCFSAKKIGLVRNNFFGDPEDFSVLNAAFDELPADRFKILDIDSVRPVVYDKIFRNMEECSPLSFIADKDTKVLDRVATQKFIGNWFDELDAFFEEEASDNEQ